MVAASKEKHPVTLPEGVSLRCVAQVLSDALEAGPHQWTGTPLQLCEGPKPRPPAPVLQDALDLFRLLHERQVDYLLVGGLSMLTYVKGRNTNDVDLLMPTLPSLYRRVDWERIHVYQSDIKTLLALHKPAMEPLFALLEKHILPTDLKELKKIVSEEHQSIAKTERGIQR